MTSNQSNYVQLHKLKARCYLIGSAIWFLYFVLALHYIGDWFAIFPLYLIFTITLALGLPLVYILSLVYLTRKFKVTYREAFYN